MVISFNALEGCHVTVCHHMPIGSSFPFLVMSAMGSQETPNVEPKRVMSPTPSAKKRLSALQRMKKLGGKLRHRSKKADAIPEDAAVEEMQEQCEAVGEQDLVVEQVAVSDPPEPATLAQHIRALVTSLPTTGPECPPVKTHPPPLDADGRPIPPPGPIRIKDPKLVKLLSDPDYMNGSEENERASVWEALDAWTCPSTANLPAVTILQDSQTANPVETTCRVRAT